MTGSIPDGVVPYRSTPEYTAETVPAGLLRDHTTAVGVWGLIEVIAGEVALRRASGDTEVLSYGKPGIVAPGEIHAVSLSTDAVFRVVFHRASGSG